MPKDIYLANNGTTFKLRQSDSRIHTFNNYLHEVEKSRFFNGNDLINMIISYEKGAREKRGIKNKGKRMENKSMNTFPIPYKNNGVKSVIRRTHVE